MAMAKFVATMLLVLLFISMLETTLVLANESQYHLDGSRYGPGSLRSYQCPSQCTRRCSRTHHRKPCMFYCQKCCKTCLCVPPGFFGNKAVCPCYNNWKTKEGAPKCP